MSSFNAKQFGKVVVLAGGTSREREISLTSGNAVLAALKELEADVELMDTQHLDINLLKSFDRAFIALHGLGGEDGQIQALLEYLNIPYTGSRVAASAITMDKVLTKKIWAAAGFKLADSFVVGTEIEAAEATKKLGLPVIFKPSLEGSSVGITLVQSITEIPKAFAEANKPGQQVLVETFIKGKEYSVGIIDEEVLPSVRMSTKRAFYDFTAKYIDNDTEYFCPSGLSEEEEQVIQQLALSAFKEVGCSGWGRVDFIRSEKGEYYLLEVNTVPGLTTHSLVPMEARAKGYSFNQLIIRILENTLMRDGSNNKEHSNGNF